MANSLQIIDQTIDYINKYPALLFSQIEFANTKSNCNQSSKMFIGGLHKNVVEADLSKYFSQFGQILEITLMADKQTNTEHGFGFIKFKDAESAKKAVTAGKDHLFHGRKIDCKIAVTRDSFKHDTHKNNQIINVLKLAFPTDAEAKLVEMFMDKKLLVDLMIAMDTFKDKNDIIGFISTTKVYYQCKNEKYYGLCLAPVAIHPQYQQNGIGTKLINMLVDKYKNEDEKNDDYVYMTVLGHHEYYNRFGFESAYKYGLKCKWKCPKDAFMIQIFDKDKFVKPSAGSNDELIIVHHLPEFDQC